MRNFFNYHHKFIWKPKILMQEKCLNSDFRKLWKAESIYNYKTNFFEIKINFDSVFFLIKDKINKLRRMIKMSNLNIYLSKWQNNKIIIR
jgi:hypothetical protein